MYRRLSNPQREERMDVDMIIEYSKWRKLGASIDLKPGRGESTERPRY